uniref:KHA domain-containing protein n=1 Tax=Nelumbo nucifera TaxID=4432 RepID=A0A822Y7S2_NELNU|nr:TPA_asm: hypothetical protein HUJ06_028544 [Nelumbo nucifera]
MAIPTEGLWRDSSQRRRTDNFNNSLFGIISAAQTGQNDLVPSVSRASATKSYTSYPARVTISCPERGLVTGKLVLLPQSLEELLAICAKKFGFSPTKVLSKDGAEIDDIRLIRDGDHLVIASDHGMEQIGD